MAASLSFDDQIAPFISCLGRRALSETESRTLLNLVVQTCEKCMEIPGINKTVLASLKGQAETVITSSSFTPKNMGSVFDFFKFFDLPPAAISVRTEVRELKKLQDLILKKVYGLDIDKRLKSKENLDAASALREATERAEREKNEAIMRSFLEKTHFTSEDCRALLEFLKQFCIHGCEISPVVGKLKDTLASAYRKAERGLNYRGELCLGDLSAIFSMVERIFTDRSIAEISGDSASVEAWKRMLGQLREMRTRYPALQIQNHSEASSAIAGIPFVPPAAGGAGAGSVETGTTGTPKKPGITLVAAPRSGSGSSAKCCCPWWSSNRVAPSLTAAGGAGASATTPLLSGKRV